jgi:hypothetical protein
MHEEIFVMVYTDPAHYSKDIHNRASQGWTPISVTERRPRPGILRILTLGLWSAVFPPKPELVVTYQRIGSRALGLPSSAIGSPLAATRNCSICGSSCSVQDVYCSRCGSPLPEMTTPISAPALPQSSGKYKIDPGNPYNLDPETGLPIKGQSNNRLGAVIMMLAAILLIIRLFS